MASLATAWRLSTDPRIESITIYQRGARLGGKGASSRGVHGRIEEHGLHVWLGYYDNAFRMMRECYGALDRERTAPECPIKAWTDAFVPADHVGLAARTDGSWTQWMAMFSPNDDLPGEPAISDTPMTPRQFVRRSLVLLADFLTSLPDPAPSAAGSVILSTSPTPPPGTGRDSRSRHAIDAAAAAAFELTQLALSTTTALPGEPAVVRGAVQLLEVVRGQLRSAVVDHPSRRRMFELADLVVTSIRGIMADGLLLDPRGFRAINGEEFRDWLRRHGAAEETFDSPLVTGVYDLVFGYRDGNPDLPRFAAGTGLYLSAKIFFDYKGSIFWKMQAGMGDVVFAPLYEALRARGVRFEFFHRVDDIAVCPDRPAISGVKLSKQVALAEDIDAYEPLREFGGLPCFPAHPDQSQLAADVADPAALETIWDHGQVVEEVELSQGVDFDDLVFGISVGMVPHTCTRLLERDQRWRDMVGRVGTVATQAFQVWLRADESRLGWSQPGSTITGFDKPFDTAASMSHLLAVEQWPEDDPPRSIVYFCSTLDEPAPPGPEQVTYPLEQAERVRASAVDYVEHRIATLLPGATSPEGFDWDQLADPDRRCGRARFSGQYWTANVDPSDRYVQSLPGTERFRLRPDDSGFDHLFLAGDWTDCGLNAGCIEAAVISGLQAANAICGDDRWNGISGYWAPLVAS